MLVSVIIPTYNRGYIITETLDSIINQTYSNWECIIVDDGSVDNTELVVGNYVVKDSRFKFYKRPQHLSKGPNVCRNYGFSKSKGEYIQWFDSDDLMKENHLELKLKNIKACDVVISPLSKFRNGVVENAMPIVPKKDIFSDYYVGNISFYISGPLWCRAFLDKHQTFFDEKIWNLDDWDFNIRMLLHFPKIKYNEASTILYRVSEDSLSKEIEKSTPNEIRSELYARFKILELYKRNNIKTSPIINSFLKERLLCMYRNALIAKQFHLAKECFNALKKMQLKKIELLKYKIALLMYKFFNKGYILTK